MPSSSSNVQDPLQNLPISAAEIASMRVVENQWGVPTLVQNERQSPSEGFAVPGADELSSLNAVQVATALQRVVQKAYPAACSQGLDDFAREKGLLDRPSEAYFSWTNSKDALEWLRDKLALYPYSVKKLFDAYDAHHNEILAAVSEEIEARRAAYDHTHPRLPEGCLYIDDRIDELERELPDWAPELAGYDGYICDAFLEVADSYVDIYTENLLDWIAEPGNYAYVEEVVQEGLVGTQNFDMIAAMMAGQEREIRDGMSYEFENGDLKEYIALRQLQEAGYVAVSDGLMEDIREVVGDIDENDRMSEIGDAVDERVMEIEVEGPIEGPKPRYTLGALEKLNGPKEKPVPEKKSNSKTPEAAEKSARQQASAETKATDARHHSKSRN